LATAFLGRVVGQIVVLAWSPSWLPALEQWESGLLPYPVLLASQIMILAFQFEVSRELWTGRGPLVKPRPALSTWVRRISVVYVLAMITRYVISMAVYPERRWFGDTIPIVFHLVLAAYLHTLSKVVRGKGGQGEGRGSGTRS